MTGSMSMTWSVSKPSHRFFVSGHRTGITIPSSWGAHTTGTAMSRRLRRPVYRINAVPLDRIRRNGDRRMLTTIVVIAVAMLIRLGHGGPRPSEHESLSESLSETPAISHVDRLRE